MPNILFDTLLAPLAGRTTPLLILADGTTISGDAFLRLVARQANALRAAGVGPDDRIAAQVAKTPEALALYAASVALGAVYLPLNTAYTADEMDYFVGDAAPRVLVCDGAREAALLASGQRHGASILTLNADGSGSLTDAAAGQADTVRSADRGPDDLAALLYTSGTTGRSKGAMLTHRNLLSNAQALAALWRFTDRDVLLHALPIFHTHGLFVASNVSLLTGGAMIFLPGFELDSVIRLIPKATAMMGVPTFYTRLLDDPRLTRDLAAHMRLFVSGSAPLLAETHETFADRTGHQILERYGMTETNMITSNPYDGERRAGTVGFPLPGVEVRLTSDGAEVASGEVGQIEVRGPNVFKGYWRMPEKTAEELRPDGFFLTGDLGRLDPDGYLQIVGRSKDLVISGGFNVYPKEVELLLDEVPGVLESAVIGLPHPDFGEAVFAVLVARKGEALNADAVLAAIRDRLARFKQPKAAVVVDALPRNTMGKVQKNLLRQTYSGWFGG
jgi:malonyl-CoA/methylmalonyl-CoA synthetase